jgi:tetratricopeptide (TPR) repeat protein
MQLKKHRFFYFLLITLLFSNLFLSCELLLLQQMLKTSNVSYESDSNIMDGWKYFFNYNDFDMAILCFQKAVKKDTLNFYAYNCLGLAYQRKGEWEKSIDAYKKSIKINPKNCILLKR